MNQALFENIIKKWRKRSDPTERLTLNQIANMVLLSGSSKNASIIGSTLSLFIQYFDPPNGPYGHKWGVNWTAVRRDHPHLVDQQPRPVPAAPLPNRPPASPSANEILDDMKLALSDEISAVRQEFEAHPLNSWIQQDLGMAGDGSFLYECYVELPGDSELPIPEGVGVLLHWPSFVNPHLVEATLLSYDSLNSLIIVDVQRLLTPRQRETQFKVVPRVDELLATVTARLSDLQGDKDSLAWRILRPNFKPRTKPSSGTISSVGLDDSQFRSVQKCFGQDVTFLWGPPGTGKTHTLARLIATAALGGKKVIATAIANVAVDQLAIKTVKALEASARGRELLDDGRVLRFGHSRLPEVTREERLFPNKLEIQNLRKQLHHVQQQLNSIPRERHVDRALAQRVVNELISALRKVTKKTIEKSPIVLTTAVQTCIEPTFHETKFDMMVVDEASMMPIPYLACIVLIGGERLIIAGDFRQLGPIALAQSRAAFDWLHKDAFTLTGITQNLSHPALSSLISQRRMRREICDLINPLFYGGMLRTEMGTENPATRLPPNPGMPAVFLSLLSRDGSEAIKTETGSRFNQRSGELVVKLAALYAGTDGLQIGVITPYRAQVSRIKALLRDAKLDKTHLERIKVGTVHAFQGAESDIVIWDLVDTEHLPIGRLYRDEPGNRLTNVAISRAREKLVIVGDREVFANGIGHKSVKALKGILKNQFSERLGNVVSARRLDYLR